MGLFGVTGTIVAHTGIMFFILLDKCVNVDYVFLKSKMYEILSVLFDTIENEISKLISITLV